MFNEEEFFIGYHDYSFFFTFNYHIPHVSKCLCKDIEYSKKKKEKLFPKPS